MRKIALVTGLALALLFVLPACGKPPASKLVCGVQTAPTDGVWTGFDAELAALLAEKLDLQIEYVQVQPSGGPRALAEGTIDCFFGGAMDELACVPLHSHQCAVIQTVRAADFALYADFAGKKAAVAEGRDGWRAPGENAAGAAAGEEGEVVQLNSQLTALAALQRGTVDFAVVDEPLARELCGQGRYSDLIIADLEVGLPVYAVCFGNGSEMFGKANAILKELQRDGAVRQLVGKYGM
ncbi:MAG: transporter substrate-binding domain-containing protein [Clostridia bacterium]|nr:transporter substrate-binding domain-containing protein [Clostridia bacterium]